VSLYLYPRDNTKYWWVAGRIYFGEKYITIRQSTRRSKKRDAWEVAQDIEKLAIIKLKGNGIPVVAFSASVIKWTELQRRSSGDLWNAERLLRFFRDKDIHAIVLDDWQRFTIKHLKNYKPSSYNRVRDTFQAILKVSGLKVVNDENAKDALYIPIRKVKGSRVIYLSHEQREMLFKHYPTWLKSWAIANAYHGFRKGEARLLERSDINFEENIIRLPMSITKSEQNRFIPMHNRLREALLSEGFRHERFVFVNSKGEPYARQGPHVAHNTALRKANEELKDTNIPTIPRFTIHDWRHHFASWYLMSGGDVESLRQIGGWSDLKMVQRYAAVSNQQKRDGINNLK
jgi:integrase